jgi:5-methylcytosine-specific restriction protein A
MGTDIKDSPDDPGKYDFTVRQLYRRRGLHDTYKGNRQKGISSPKDHPIVFVFTGPPGERYGYDDKFLEDDRLRYTGVGTEGDQKMEGMNAKLKNHKENGDDVHVFKEVQENPSSIVSYVGEYEYEDVEEVCLEDENGDSRRAFEFLLKPLGE